MHKGCALAQKPQCTRVAHYSKCNNAPGWSINPNALMLQGGALASIRISGAPRDPRPFETRHARGSSGVKVDLRCHHSNQKCHPSPLFDVTIEPQNPSGCPLSTRMSTLPSVPAPFRHGSALTGSRHPGVLGSSVSEVMESATGTAALCPR